MLAKEMSQAFEHNSPVAVTIYHANRQMPHFHREALEIIMCLRAKAMTFCIMSAAAMASTKRKSPHWTSSEKRSGRCSIT